MTRETVRHSMEHSDDMVPSIDKVRINCDRRAHTKTCDSRHGAETSTHLPQRSSSTDLLPGTRFFVQSFVSPALGRGAIRSFWPADFTNDVGASIRTEHSSWDSSWEQFCCDTGTLAHSVCAQQSLETTWWSVERSSRVGGLLCPEANHSWCFAWIFQQRWWAFTNESTGGCKLWLFWILAWKGSCRSEPSSKPKPGTLSHGEPSSLPWGGSWDRLCHPATVLESS